MPDRTVNLRDSRSPTGSEWALLAFPARAGRARDDRAGQVGLAVTQIALIQDGHDDRRPLESHLGAWVIYTQPTSPFQVTALDANGTVLASLEESNHHGDAPNGLQDRPA